MKLKNVLINSVMMIGSLFALGAGAVTQTVAVSPDSDLTVAIDGTEVTFAVTYATDPDLAQTTGIGINLHYDSTKLTFVSFSANEDVSDSLGNGEKPEDEGTIDASEVTDRVVYTSYASTQSEFPDTDDFIKDGQIVSFQMPVELFSVTFSRASADFAGPTTLNFTTTTGPGNEVVADSFDIVFKDDEVPPEITLAETSITVEAVGPTTSEDNSPELAAFIQTITVTDNKDTDISTDAINAFLTDEDGALVEAPEGFMPGTYEVTLIAVDSAQNESQPVTITVTVEDTTAPMIMGGMDVTLAAVGPSGAPSAGAVTVSAVDLVDGQVEVVLSVGDTAVPDSYPLGETVVSVTATDSAGLTATATLTVTVSDQTPPEILDTSAVTLEATGPSGYSGSVDNVIAAVTASDNVDADPVVAFSASQGVDGFTLGTTVVGVTVTDAAGNATSGSVSVTVVDTTAPSFSGANQLVLTVDTEVAVASSDQRVTDWLAGVSATDLVDGDTEVMNSALPAEFPVGPTTITFTSTDAAGNVASEDVIVLVAVGPSVTVADSITVVSLDGEAVPASQAQISAFISAVTAEDFSGSALDVTNNAPDSFPLGETVVTFTAVDADDRQGQNSASVTVVSASAENDTDGDGIDDLFEVENSLDPNDAADAEGDADGDGRSNLDEYLENKDPNSDDVAPVVTAPVDVFADSEGALTSVDLGEASALDALDGELMPTADNLGPFAPGTYIVTWTATDAAGNASSATQQIVVTPQATTQPRARAAEGGVYVLNVNLNGPASSYPVEIPYTLGGTANLGDDFSVDAETVVIADGLSGLLTFNFVSDDVEEGTEGIEVALGAPAAGAVLGAASTAVISIVESAEPPALKLSASQGGNLGRKVSSGGGNVTVLLTITDPNGTHDVDWTSSDASLVRLSEDEAMVFEFSPEGLEGGFSIVANVTDSGLEGETFTIDQQVLIVADVVEADSDGDGIADSKDDSNEPNVIAVDADASDAAVTADEGVTLVIGDAALANGTSGIAITEETIASSGQDGGDAPTNGSDEDYDYPLGVYDFQVQDLPVPGQSARVVIPLGAGVPAEAEARKYTEATGWKAFVIDENNAVATAPGSDGACPGVGSDLFIAGLTEGDTCLQLTLQDGGPNDADGLVNGEIDDPSGIAEPAPVLVVELNTEGYQNRKKVGGGCSVAEGPGDFGLILLAMLAGLGMLRRRLLRSA